VRAVVERERLPDRRAAEGFEVEALARFHTSMGRFDDGRIAEIFIDTNKAGSMAGVLASDSAVLASLALHGLPLDVLRHALMRDAGGRPSGRLGAVLDRIAAEEGGP
jgi:hypothetical protein